MKRIVLHHHRLQHIGELRVDPEIFTHRFAADTSMCRCNGTCCQDGVLLDLEEKEKILAHADLIRRYMEDHQEHDPAKWFDEMIEDDTDFRSGKCDGTAADQHGCVFLDSQGLCTLQKAAMAEGMDKYALKPFYCVAFPITVDEHTLTLYESEFTGRRQCCSASEQGDRTLLEVCGEELQYVLGEEGAREIEEIFRRSNNDPRHMPSERRLPQE